MTDDNRTMIDKDHLREMIEVISGELELRPLLTMIVQKACELLHADRGSIGLVDLKHNYVRIEAIYKMPKEELGSVAHPGEGLAGQVYRDRAPVLIERYGAISTPQLEGMDEDSVVGMPILWRGDIIGTFGIGAGPPKRFGDNDMRMLEVFARHAAIAINNAQSYEREKHYAALKERQRLARDLHDNISQLIFSMSLVGQSISPGFEKNQSEGEARVNRMLDIASLAQREMKVLLTQLQGLGGDTEGSMAAFAVRNGLAAALNRHASLVAPETARIDIQIDETLKLDILWTETLLRIAQEAMANAFRHGQADLLNISLKKQGVKACFRIEDNGCGIPSSGIESPSSTHIGLESMRNRSAAAGGQISVQNRPDGGVCVEVRFTLP